MRIRTAIAATALTAAAVLGSTGSAFADGRHGGGGAWAHGSAEDSSGFISGNVAQVPIHIPINACGNTGNVIGALNPAFGNECTNK